MLFAELSLSAQSAYAEILDQTRSRAIDSLASLSGAFHTRTIKNKSYVYFGYRDPNGVGKMIYVGPNDERVKALVEKFNTEKIYQKMSALVKSAEVLGCQSMMTKHFKVTQQLANYGFFKAGGILVGTHAFLAMGNMLGVKWASGNKTLDVDFAHAGKNISIALPANLTISVHDALTSLEMGLLPIQQFSGVAGAQYRNPKDQELRVDFLTSVGREKDNVVMKDLGLSLEPLKFMEFSLEGTTQAVVLGRSDACLVNIPAPERFAIHKLIVYGERKPEERVKSVKDVEQAAALVSWHVSNGLISNIADSWEDAMSRGPGWRTRAQEGLDFMLSRHPELKLSELWGERLLAKAVLVDFGAVKEANVELGRYRGVLVEDLGGRVVQNQGKGTAVAHERGRLVGEVVVGRNVEIGYEGGKGVVRLLEREVGVVRGR